MATDKTKKTMDITRPGKTPPDASSRPVVVSHGPMVQDPMMVSEEEKTPTPDVTPPAEVTEPPSHKNKVIQPLSEQTGEGAAPEAQAPASEAKADVTAAEVTKDTANDTPASPESSESAVVDAVADQVGAGRKKGDLSKEEKTRQEAVQKLVAEKTYFLPLGHGHSRHKRLSLPVIVLVIIVLFVGAYLAVDAGVLDIGVELPISIIKE
jgi:hypothetical protein